MKNTLLRIVCSLALLFAVSSFVACDSAVDKMLRAASEEINGMCPIRVDEKTELSGTEVLPDKTFRYRYTASLPEGVEASQVQELLKNMALANVKSSDDMALFRQAEVTLSYLYEDADGNELFRFEITPEEYK